MELYEKKRIIIDLIGDMKPIIDSIVKSLSNSRHLDVDEVNDWANLKCVREKLVSLHRLMEAEQEFVIAFNGIKKMANSDKEAVMWSLPIMASLRDFVKDTLLEGVEDLIELSREIDFESYRARDFQSELNKNMKMLRADYRDIFHL